MPKSDTGDIALSIIICTRNRAAILQETLTALENVSGPAGLPTEVIVVDNGSTDDTAAVVRAARHRTIPIQYLCEPRPGQVQARNAGIAHARGEIIQFTDDDIRPPADWLDAMAAPLLAGMADAVGGGITMASHLKRPWMTAYHYSLMASTEYLDRTTKCLIGANFAFRRSVLEKVPAFDVELGPGALGQCDDSLFALQVEAAGLTIQPLLDNTVEHHFEPSRLTRESFLNRVRNEGRSEAYVMYHWSHEDFPTYPRYVAILYRDLLRWRLKNWRHYRGEGIHSDEMFLVKQLHRYKHLLLEKQRPRNYERRGLVKHGFTGT